jgi:hypothetical protein
MFGFARRSGINPALLFNGLVLNDRTLFSSRLACLLCSLITALLLCPTTLSLKGVSFLDLCIPAMASLGWTFALAIISSLSLCGFLISVSLKESHSDAPFANLHILPNTASNAAHEHPLTAQSSIVEVPMQNTSISSSQKENQHMPLLIPAFFDQNSVVVAMAGNLELDTLGREMFSGKICRHVQGKYTNVDEYNNHSTLVNVTFSCFDLFKTGLLGSGNILSAFYALRAVAHTLGTRTDVIIQCPDAEEEKKRLILPWVMGMYPRLSETERLTQEAPSLKQACGRYESGAIGYRWNDIRYDMRRMAIAMVGIPSPDHPSAGWAEEHLWSDTNPHRHGRDYMQLASPQRGDAPLFPNTELDDAMLHFRCGDIISMNHPNFGFIKFGSFSRHLSPDVRTIGIATQPFDPSAQQRNEEGGLCKLRRCKQVVTAFVEHLKEQFPKARIRVHNGLNETIALTFARMVMANQTVIAITSFGAFPGIGTFGTAYITYPEFRSAPNRWLVSSPLVERVGNVKLVKEPRLMSGEVMNGWGENGTSVIEWFNNYSLPNLVVPTLAANSTLLC